MLSLRKSIPVFFAKSKVIFRNELNSVVKRNGSYRSSRKYDPEDKVAFESAKDPNEWKFVERLLPLKSIPEPLPKDSYPSGWKPSSPEAVNAPYYIRRTRNHMTPVYIKFSQRGTRKITVIKNIFGDIWNFTSDLNKYIESKVQYPVGYRVDEVGCKVLLRGDYLCYANEFLLEKGY